MVESNDFIHLPDAGGVIFAANWAGIASLHKKLATVMAHISTVFKDEKHQQGWTYASYSDVAQELRKAMGAANLGLSMTVLEAQQSDDAKGIKTRATVEFTLADGDTGAMKVCRWISEAVDFGVADKGMNKAYTSAEKYFLMRTFLVSTSDDVEPDAEDGKSNHRQAAQAPAKPAAQAEPAKSAQPGNGDKPAPTQPTQGKATRPAEPETVKRWVGTKALGGGKDAPSEGQRGLATGVLNDLFPGIEADMKTAKRHSVLMFLFGKDSSKSLTSGECSAVISWASDKAEDGSNVPNEYAVKEAAAMVAAYEQSKGQATLDMGAGK